MHAVALAIAEVFAVLALAIAHPFAIAIGGIAVLPNLHKVILVDVALMIRMGRVEGNRMVKMQLTNEKLIDRGTRMIADELGISYDEARQRLLSAGSVDKVLKQKL